MYCVENNASNKQKYHATCPTNRNYCYRPFLDIGGNLISGLSKTFQNFSHKLL